MKFSFSQRYLRWPGGLSISVCISLSLPLKHISQVLLPFLFIIHIYSALTEILIFDGDQLEKCKDGLHTCNSTAALLLITLRNKLMEVWNILWVPGEQSRFITRESAGCHLAVRLKRTVTKTRTVDGSSLSGLYCAPHWLKTMKIKKQKGKRLWWKHLILISVVEKHYSGPISVNWANLRHSNGKGHFLKESEWESKRGKLTAG